MPQESIVREQQFGCTASQVWQALTDPALMRQWYFEKIQAFKAELGFACQFDVETEGRIFRHLWQVTEVKLEQQLSYSWAYEGIAGRALVSWQLTPNESGTLLKMTQSFLEPFPADDPIFSRQTNVEGWDYLIGESLAGFLSQ